MLFMSLMYHSEKHLQAEGYFGLACLNAIKGDITNAAAYLVLVVNPDKMNFFDFRNRALLDADLEPLRKEIAEFETSWRLEEQQ